jgi:aerotaxis receptor
VRFKPTSPLLAVVQRIYREVRARELEVEAGEARNRKASIEAGTERLHELLAAEGFADYERFMHHALVTELTARREGLAAEAAQADRVAADGALGGALRVCDDADRRLDGLVAELEHLGEAGDRLAKKSAFLLELAEEIKLFALNAVLSSSRLGTDGAALGAVAEIMGRCSTQAGPAIARLEERLVASTELLGAMTFRIAASKLQADMVTVYIRELLRNGQEAGTVAHELVTLAQALAEGAERLAEAMRALDVSVRDMQTGVDEVEAQLRMVRALEMNGRVEAASVPSGGTIRGVFDAIGQQVEAARAQVVEFRDLGRLSAGGTSADREVLDRMQHAAARVAALAR